MCMTIAVCLLLLVLLAGYLVLIKASGQSGKLKVIGQVIAWIVIGLASFGMLCTLGKIHCKSKKYAGFCDKKAVYQSGCPSHLEKGKLEKNN